MSKYLYTALISLILISPSMTEELSAKPKDSLSNEELNYMVGIYLQDVVKNISSDCKADLEQYVKSLHNKSEKKVYPSYCMIKSIEKMNIR